MLDFDTLVSVVPAGREGKSLSLDGFWSDGQYSRGYRQAGVASVQVNVEGLAGFEHVRSWDYHVRFEHKYSDGTRQLGFEGPITNITGRGLSVDIQAESVDSWWQKLEAPMMNSSGDASNLAEILVREATSARKGAVPVFDRRSSGFFADVNVEQGNILSDVIESMDGLGWSCVGNIVYFFDPHLFKKGNLSFTSESFEADSLLVEDMGGLYANCVIVEGTNVTGVASNRDMIVNGPIVRRFEYPNIILQNEADVVASSILSKVSRRVYLSFNGDAMLNQAKVADSVRVNDLVCGALCKVDHFTSFRPVSDWFTLSSVTVDATKSEISVGFVPFERFDDA